MSQICLEILTRVICSLCFVDFVKRSVDSVQNELFVCFYSDLSEKKSDLRVCDAGTCRFGGTCRENGADIKCVCPFHVSLCPVTHH